jgi:glucan-binding YG repeat protein
MVNITGDALTGWQKDSTGGTYMLPTAGVMQTGWVKDGLNGITAIQMVQQWPQTQQLTNIK